MVIGVGIFAAVGEIARPPGPRVHALRVQQALHPGMTYADAVRILGRDGLEMGRRQRGDLETVSYAWFQPDFLLTFQDDRLVHVQVGP